MGRFYKEASDAAFAQWGRRHERGLITFHFTLTVLKGIAALAIVYTLLHFINPDVFTIAWPKRIAYVLAAWPFVVILIGVAVIAVPYLRSERSRTQLDPTQIDWSDDDDD